MDEPIASLSNADDQPKNLKINFPDALSNADDQPKNLTANFSDASLSNANDQPKNLSANFCDASLSNADDQPKNLTANFSNTSLYNADDHPKNLTANLSDFTPKPKRSRGLTEEEKQERKRKKEEREREEAAQRKEAALNQMRYLLSVCEEYSEIYKKTIMDTQQKALKEKNKNYVAHTLEDVNDIQKEIKKKNKIEKDCNVSKYMKYFEGGQLHPYQLEGVTWLYMLYANASNGILADEMGLGKTVQVIALISVLLAQGVKGPFLIVAPLSTIPNWQNEFKRFAPKVPVVCITGLAENRAIQLRQMMKKHRVGDIDTYPVVLVTYQTPLIEFHKLNQLKWRYIIIDEGHRIKNHECQLSQKLRELKSESRLLLTGTPLQNNIVELWALLNFLLPNFFSNMSTFTELFLIEDMQDKDKLIHEEQSNHIVSKIHKVLAPFMLRRLKKDVLKDMVPKKEVTVYCPLSPLQLKLYDFVIERNIKGLRGETEERINLDEPRAKRKCTLNRFYHIPDEDDDLEIDELELDENDTQIPKNELSQFAKVITRLTMTNTLMMFRKIVNHPYLVHFPLDPDSEKKQLLINEELVTSSGKLLVLDTLLPKLKQLGHKVLLFSQLCMGLDLLEEYMILRNFPYRRLDGSHRIEQRSENINSFNQDPNVFIFLLSTKAGGLGLNLVAADTVIFFDRDWNPQIDIQAQDRCHRIGQKKPVVIYSLVARNTIDEAVIDSGKLKRVLEKVVISDGKFKTITKDDKAKTEDYLLELRKTLQQKDDEDCYIFSNKLELDKLLDRTDLYEIMRKQQNEEKEKAKSSKPTSRGKNKENKG